MCFLIFSFLLSVKFSQNGKSDDTSSDNRDVIPSANEGWEEHRVRGWPEHIPMYLLPTILITKVLFLNTEKIIHSINHMYLSRANDQTLTFHNELETRRSFLQNDKLWLSFVLFDSFLILPFHIMFDINLWFCVVRSSLIDFQHQEWVSFNVGTDCRMPHW